MTGAFVAGSPTVGESRSAKPSTEFGIHGAASGFWLPTAPLGFPFHRSNRIQRFSKARRTAKSVAMVSEVLPSASSKRRCISTGTLTVANGGTMNVMRGAQTVFVAEPAGSTGTVNIGAASVAAAVAPGFINAAHVLCGAGADNLCFNHTATDYVFAPMIARNGPVNVISGI